MKRPQAISMIRKAIKKKYGTQLAAAKALDINPILISRVLTGITEQIAPELLELAGLVENPQPERTYRRKEQ